jgi:hypothetical protein
VYSTSLPVHVQVLHRTVLCPRQGPVACEVGPWWTPWRCGTSTNARQNLIHSTAPHFEVRMAAFRSVSWTLSEWLAPSPSLPPANIHNEKTLPSWKHCKSRSAVSAIHEGDQSSTRSTTNTVHLGKGHRRETTSGRSNRATASRTCSRVTHHFALGPNSLISPTHIRTACTQVIRTQTTRTFPLQNGRAVQPARTQITIERAPLCPSFLPRAHARTHYCTLPHTLHPHHTPRSIHTHSHIHTQTRTHTLPPTQTRHDTTPIRPPPTLRATAAR